MNDHEKDVYLIKQRSGRNLSSAGWLIPVVLVVSLLIPVANAPWLSWWLRIPAILGICLSFWLGLQSVFQLIRNPVIELKISKHGIHYGHMYLDWEEIGRLYPRGGLTLLGTRKYQLGYTMNGKLQTTNDLPVDGGISKEEFNEMLDKIENRICPTFTQLRLKRP